MNQLEETSLQEERQKKTPWNWCICGFGFDACSTLPWSYLFSLLHLHPKKSTKPTWGFLTEPLDWIPDLPYKTGQRPEQVFVDFAFMMGKEKQVKHLEQRASGCLVCALKQTELMLELASFSTFHRVSGLCTKVCSEAFGMPRTAANSTQGPQ